MPKASRLRAALAALLVLSAGGFALAARSERSQEAGSTTGLGGPEGSPAREAAERSASGTVPTTAPNLTTVPEPVTSTTADPLTAPEGSPEREAAERSHRTPLSAAVTTSSLSTGSAPTLSAALPTGAATTTTTSAVHSHVVGEKLFGVRTESPAATAAAVVVLLTAALAAATSRRRVPLLGIAALAGAFAFLDAREALHQHDEGRASLVAAAAALAVSHLLASALGLLAHRRESPGRVPSDPGARFA
jgi:hypothetical protein